MKDNSGSTAASGSPRQTARNGSEGATKRLPRHVHTAQEQPSRASGRSAKTTATTLVEMALEKYHVGQSHEGEAFVYPRQGPLVVSTLRSGKASLRSELARQYFTDYGNTVGQQQLTDALTTLEGIAQAAEPCRLWLRVAKYEGANYLDLGDPSGYAIRIADGGWTVGPPPVMFRRTALTAALPIPERGGSLHGMWDAINVTAADRPLLVAYLVAALEPDIPHPVLGIFGEQGTGKSSTMRALVSFLDPSPVPYRKPPRDDATWLVSAAASWIVALDNLRAVPNWLSDLLCRAVTGEGAVQRRLYTDADLQTFAYRRVVIVNGIDLGNLSGDLADRLLPITLERFDDEGRREETELRATFEREHARVLGAILDVAASALSLAPAVELRHRPRMLDFARVVAAVDKTLGRSGFDRYMSARTRIASETVTSDPLTVRLAGEVREPFEGTASELLAIIDDSHNPRVHRGGLPRSARSMTQALQRLAPTLRHVGWQVQHDEGHNKQGIVRWTLVPPCKDCGADPPPPPDPPSPASRRNDRDTSAADVERCERREDGTWRATQGGRLRPHQLKAECQAGQAGQDCAASPDDLIGRAHRYLADLPNAAQEALTARCSRALADAAEYPDWWSITAQAEPQAVIVALELIAEDRRDQRPLASPNIYLTAAREASRRLSTSKR
jgi:hypothetical protein